MSEYISGLKSALPLNDRQLESIYRIVEAMEHDRSSALFFEVSNFRQIDDFMALYIEPGSRGLRVELDYPMDDWGWKYPLVLAGNLSLEKTKELLRRTLRDLEETYDIDFVFNGFRSVTPVRYGAQEPEKFSKE